MNEKNNINLFPFYMILGLTGASLIITGLLLGAIFSALSVDVSNVVKYILQTTFVLSGILDFVLLFYVRNKLN